MSDEAIIGWRGLQQFVGRCEAVLRRPRRFNQWTKVEVEKWLKENKLPSGIKNQRWA